MIRQFAHVSGGSAIGPVDVCIIGSGAGGAVAAYYLARAGLSVVVLEKGGYYPTEELGRSEVTQLTRIQATDTMFTPAGSSNTRVSLIAGECVGGGTVASESVTWDLPRVVMEDWVKLGLASFAPGPRMKAYQDELNTLLNVQPVPNDNHNGCNQILKIGAQREGISWKAVDRPVDGCRRCGNCTQGCRFGAKRDATLFLRGAMEKGAEIFAGARVDRVKINFGGPDDRPGHGLPASAQQTSPAKFTVRATVLDRKIAVGRVAEPGERSGKSLTVHARNVVMAAGPVGTSRLLLKSGINPAGVVGKKFGLHPTSFNIGRFPGLPLNGWDGINDTIEVHHFADLNRHQSYYQPDRHGFLLEGALSLPWGLANLLPGTGREHLARMADMNHLAGIEVNVKSDAYGRITPEALEFELSERDSEAMLYGTWITARLFFRAVVQSWLKPVPATFGTGAAVEGRV